MLIDMMVACCVDGGRGSKGMRTHRYTGGPFDFPHPNDRAFFFGRVGEEGCAHRYDGGVFWRVVWGGCGGGWR